MTQSVSLALAPVREALLARAHADADREIAAADAQARAVLATAQAEADGIVDDARRAGRAEAAAVSTAAAARIRRQSRAALLAAQREAYDGLLTACRSQVGALRDDPAWPQALAGLAATARAAAGDGSAVTESSSGLVAETDSTRVEITMDALAERLVGRLGDDVRALWTP